MIRPGMGQSVRSCSGDTRNGDAAWWVDAPLRPIYHRIEALLGFVGMVTVTVSTFDRFDSDGGAV